MISILGRALVLICCISMLSGPLVADEGSAGAAPDAVGNDQEAWPVFRGNPSSSGVATSQLPPQLDVLWRFSVEGGAFEGAAAIVDGVVYIGDLDGKIYALAQGAVSVGGFSAGGAAGGGVAKNHTTVARVAGGATVEREIPLSLNNKKELTIVLNSPDFMTATRIADVINARLGGD